MLAVSLRQTTAPLSRTIVQLFDQRRWATKKSGASKARQKKGTDGKRLGLKKFEGDIVESGNIIAKQHGTKYHPGQNVGVGRDHTLYALVPGYVHFTKDAARDRLVAHVLDKKPEDHKHSDEMDVFSKIAEGWRNDSVFKRETDGSRRFELVDVSRLPPASEHDLSSQVFSPMKAYIKHMGLSDKLPTDGSYQFADRFKSVREMVERANNQ